MMAPWGKKTPMRYDIHKNEESVEKEVMYTDPGAQITKPFDPKKIDILTKQMILEAIFRRLRNNEIDMCSGFQRRSDLWNITQQSRLIESILIRFPLPAFYFDGTDDDKWLVVDGLQRLSTFRSFVINKTMRLEGLEYLSQFNTLGFDDLPRDLQRRIEEHEITVYIINPGTPPEVKYNIFRRINTGGLVLEPAEIRHALNQGVPAQFVQLLAENTEFKKATANAISPERMLDRDFVTRFLAFYMYSPSEYKGNLEDLMNHVMAALYAVDQKERDTIMDRFSSAMIAARRIFGTHAFRKQYSENGRRNPINKALFETWSVSLAKMSEDSRQNLIAHKNQVVKSFIRLLNSDDKFDKSISSGTGEKRNVMYRFNRIENIIREVINDQLSAHQEL